MIRRVLLVLLVLLVALVGFVAAAPFVLPASVQKRFAEYVLTAATGRNVRIDGAFHLRAWPPFAVELEQLRVADAAWAGEPEMLTVTRLRIEADGGSLFGDLPVIERVELVEPRLSLRRDAQGRANWALGGGESGHPSGGGRGGREESGPPLFVRELVLTNGRLVIEDDTVGMHRTFDDIDIRLGQDAAGEPLALEARVLAGSAVAALSGTLPDPMSLAGGTGGPVSLVLSLPGGAVRLAGELEAGAAGPQLVASVDATFDAPRQTLDWLGIHTELPGDALGSFTFAAAVDAAPQRVALAGLRLAVDDVAIAGDLAVERGDARPRLTGRIVLGSLRLERYLPAGAAGNTGEGGERADAQGWSEEPLSLPLPLPFDLALDIAFDLVEARGLRLEEGDLRLEAEGAEAAVQVRRLGLYGGTARGRLQVAAADPPQTSGTTEFRGVEIAPLLAALGGIERLEGVGDADLEWSAVGTSMRALTSDVDGRGMVLLRDGTIRGINIAALVRQVVTLGREGRGEPLRTDFAELGGSFTITDGIVDNPDLALRAPLLRVAGRGTIDLPRRTLSYRLEPRLAATLQGQAASGEPDFAAGVPIVIEGPWSAPEWRVELAEGISRVLTDPGRVDALIEELRASPELLGRLKERMGGALGELLGVLPPVGGTSAPPDQGTEGSPVPLLPKEAEGAKQLLEGLFGR